MRLSLLPKKSEFFVLFEQHAQNAVEAAEALAKLLGDFTDIENKVRDIHAIEHHGDKLNHEIVPTGIPGVIDSLQRAIEDLKRKFFGP